MLSNKLYLYWVIWNGLTPFNNYKMADYYATYRMLNGITFCWTNVLIKPFLFILSYLTQLRAKCCCKDLNLNLTKVFKIYLSAIWRPRKIRLENMMYVVWTVFNIVDKKDKLIQSELSSAQPLSYKEIHFILLINDTQTLLINQFYRNNNSILSIQTLQHKINITYIRKNFLSVSHTTNWTLQNSIKHM